MLAIKKKLDSEKRILISVIFHSAAIIAFQISLMQLISIVQWHHFAYMIISIAMLGFGASGTLLALTKSQLLKRSKWLVPVLMIMSGLLMMLVFQLSLKEILRFDVFFLFSSGRGWISLIFNYLLFFLPFFSGSLAIGILFVQKSNQIGPYYFSNLTGSALGGIFALGLMSRVLPSEIPFWIGLLPVLSGIILASPRWRWIGIIGALILLITVKGIESDKLKLSEYKDLEKMLLLPEARVKIRKPSIYGLIEVVSSPAMRYAPGLSLTFEGEIPGNTAVFFNGNYFGPVFSPGKSNPGVVMDYTTRALPFMISKPQRVLCINAGTGSAIWHSIHHGAQKIDATFNNRAVIDLVENELREVSGNLFELPGVKAHPQQTRNFLAQKISMEYDLIILPLMDAFGGTAGLSALREEYSYTMEAFVKMINHLSPEGMISVSTWLDYPPRTSLKIAATLVAAAEKTGIDNPNAHMAAIRSWGTVTFVLKKQTVTQEETAKIREFCQKMSFDPLLLPDLREGERQQFNLMEDIQFFEHLDKILDHDKEIFSEYPFDIGPSTDDKPYFSQFMRIKSLRHLVKVFGSAQVPFLELGYLTLLVTLIQSTILAFLLIVIPLFRLKKGTPIKTSTLIYFGSLGLGYMFAEIILIQRFIFYWGNAVIAVAAVISIMLFFSGLGSLLSQKWPPGHTLIRSLAFLVAGLLFTFGMILTPVLKLTLSLGILLKAVISLFAIGTPSFVMGMLFPLGIRFLGNQREGMVAWAWGINGCLSVISTSLATLIAVEQGFLAVILIASLAYLVAGLAFSLKLEKSLKNPFLSKPKSII